MVRDGHERDDSASTSREREARPGVQTQELAEIIRTIGLAELKLLEAILEKQRDLAKRVTNIEAKVNYAAGAMAILALIFTFGLDLIKGILRP